MDWRKRDEHGEIFDVLHDGTRFVGLQEVIDKIRKLPNGGTEEHYAEIHAKASFIDLHPSDNAFVLKVSETEVVEPEKQSASQDMAVAAVELITKVGETLKEVQKSVESVNAVGYGGYSRGGFRNSNVRGRGNRYENRSEPYSRGRPMQRSYRGGTSHRGGGGQREEGRTCHYCGQPDHFIRDCPYKKVVADAVAAKASRDNGI